MAIVIELIAPDIRTHTARVLGRGHPDIEDVQQTVNMKLFRRLRDPINPFRVDSFPSFLKFVQLTVRGVAIDWRRAQAHTPSPLPDDGWREPIQPSEVNQVERQASRARLLELIPDERDRELFRRFLLLDESPATVHAVMRQRYSDLTITDVYRTLERVLRQLSKLPEVREMYESNAE
jgi:DNA-directed RNA polymerase specialized sigma24 family protein